MPEPIRFLALDREYAEVRSEVATRFQRVLETQSFVQGQQAAELEASVRRLTGARHAVACSSGSDALYLALRALDIGPGSAVLVPAYTFIASAEAIVNVGAVPVFTDVRPDTLDVGATEIEAAVEREFRRTGDGRVAHRDHGTALVAVLVVHLFGRACRMREISETAGRLGIHVVEDAAQAIGAVGDATVVGAWGAAGCFSFYPTKNLGGAGDGGVVTTMDATMAERIARLRVHGAGAGPIHEELGINARMGELQAAYLNAKWPCLQRWNRARESVAASYDRLLTRASAAELATLAPAVSPAHIHHQYAVRLPAGRRDDVRARLASEGIETRVFYPVPLHRQPCFARSGSVPARLPVAEAAADEILCLPIHPFLTAADVERVCNALVRAIRP
jgi:dTDP-4-amino-4,6-dideoxygalactose transaminase